MRFFATRFVYRLTRKVDNAASVTIDAALCSNVVLNNRLVPAELLSVVIETELPRLRRLNFGRRQRVRLQ
jgi:hypothetical protein